MNDYERLVDDIQQAIDVTETAYSNAQDEEDQGELEEAIERLRAVQKRAQEKSE